MAITTIREPLFLEPAFQYAMPFKYSSTNATFSNFKYLFEVYTSETINGSYSYRTTINHTPRPDGTGLITPHDILKANLGYSVNPFITTLTAATESLVHYRMALYEFYSPSITYSSIGTLVGGTLSFTTNLGVDLLPGDIIRLDKDDKTTNIVFDVETTIVSQSSLPGLNLVTTNSNIVANSVTPGVLTSDTGRIIELRRRVGTSSSLASFNATKQYDELNTWSSTYLNYLVGSPTSSSAPFNYKFLNIYPNATTSSTVPSAIKKPIYYSATASGIYSTWQTLSFILSTQSYFGLTAAPLTAQYNLYTDEDGLNFATSLSIGITASLIGGTLRYDIPAGPANLPALFNDTIKSYEVFLDRPSPRARMTEVRWFKIVKQCREYELIELAFVNKLGAMEYFTFNLVSKVRSNISRTVIKEPLSFEYKIGDLNYQNINVDIFEEYTINSDFLSDDEALYIKELVESPYVYYLKDGLKLPIVITNNSYDLKTTLNDLLIQYTINFRFGYDKLSNI